MSKLQHVQNYLDSNKLGLAIFSDPISIYYLTGYLSDPHERHMLLFVMPDHESLLFLPGLDVERAVATVDFPVAGYMDSENPWQIIKNKLPQKHFSAIGAEFDNLNLTRYHGLQSIFNQPFSDITPLINTMKLIKSRDEIEKMLVAGEFADKAMQVGFDNISLNVTETDIIAQIEFEMKKQGISKMSFDTMVLTGDNAANPHGIPSTNKIENDALLLFDLGVETLGYTSDMTRTVAVGKPDQFKQDIYNLTLEAHMTAVNMIKPGVTASEIDYAARSVIEKAGYGEHFTHGIGHGIGLDIHEIPFFGNSDELVEVGMTITDEPGIYLDNKYGVRIEDDLVVTEKGCEVLTLAPKELIVL